MSSTQIKLFLLVLFGVIKLFRSQEVEYRSIDTRRYSDIQRTLEFYDGHERLHRERSSDELRECTNGACGRSTRVVHRLRDESTAERREDIQDDLRRVEDISIRRARDESSLQGRRQEENENRDMESRRNERRNERTRRMRSDNSVERRQERMISEDNSRVRDEERESRERFEMRDSRRDTVRELRDNSEMKERFELQRSKNERREERRLYDQQGMYRESSPTQKMSAASNYLSVSNLIVIGATLMAVENRKKIFCES